MPDFCGRAADIRAVHICLIQMQPEVQLAGPGAPSSWDTQVLAVSGAAQDEVIRKVDTFLPKLV
jgi:hypothetical protein